MNKPLCAGVRPDITLVDYPICIEADGDYWHSFVETKQRDKERDRIMENLGYIPIHFTESEIRKDVSACMQKAKEIIFRI